MTSYNDLQAAHKLFQTGHLSDAEKAYRIILKSMPNQFDALHHLGVIYARQQRYADAIRCFSKALKVCPNRDTEGLVYDHLGSAYMASHQHQDAVYAYHQASVRTPKSAQTHYHLGNALREIHDFTAASASFVTALSLDTLPDTFVNLWNRAIAFNTLNRYEDAIVCYRKAIIINPTPEGYDALGTTLAGLQRHSEAIENFAKAQALNPNHANSHLNEGHSRLALGDFEAGWQQYEWRFATAAYKDIQREFPQSQWHGEDLTGKTLLLIAEQGIGDSIQMLRYLPMLADRGANLILEIHAGLVPLVGTLPGVISVHAPVSRGSGSVAHWTKKSLREFPMFDYHCHLMSLPHLLGTTLMTIPSTVPYLHAPRMKIAQWCPMVEQKGLRTGIVWAGNKRLVNDARRSIPLSVLMPAITSMGTSVVALQKELRPGDRELLAASEITVLADQLCDFTDTAAIISMLKLVITVDTSVAHLAGALGKPVLLLLPYYGTDARWLLDRDDSPWYPTITIIRQTVPDDWTTVMEQVRTQASRRSGHLHP